MPSERYVISLLIIPKAERQTIKIIEKIITQFKNNIVFLLLMVLKAIVIITSPAKKVCFVIAKLTKERNDVKNNLQNKKKALVKIFNSMSEANYLDSDIYDYLIEDIQSKFTKKIKEESDEDEY